MAVGCFFAGALARQALAPLVQCGSRRRASRLRGAWQLIAHDLPFTIHRLAIVSLAPGKRTLVNAQSRTPRGPNPTTMTTNRPRFAPPERRCSVVVGVLEGRLVSARNVLVGAT